MTRHSAFRHSIVLLTAVMAAATSAHVAAQANDPNSRPPAAAADRLLSRRYVDGERLRYLMKAINDKTPHEGRITATTKKGTGGGFVEEFAWSGMIVNGAPRELAPQPRRSA